MMTMRKFAKFAQTFLLSFLDHGPHDRVQKTKINFGITTFLNYKGGTS